MNYLLKNASMKKLASVLFIILISSVCAPASYSQSFLKKVGRALDKVLDDSNESSNSKKKVYTQDEYYEYAWKKPYISNSTIEVIVDRIPTDYTSFQEGVAWIENSGSKGGWIPIDTLGKVALDYVHMQTNAQRPQIPYFWNGVTVVRDASDWNSSDHSTTYCYLMDRQGNKIKHLPGIADYGYFNANGVAEGLVKKKKEGTSGHSMTHYELYSVYFNTDGDIVFDTGNRLRTHDSMTGTFSFSEDRMPYYNYEKQTCGYVDTDFNIVIPAIYKNSYGFREGLALVQHENGNWGFIDKDGEVVIDFKYSHRPTSFYGGYAVVRKREGEDPFMYINKEGKIVHKDLFSAKVFDGDYAFAEVRDPTVKTILLDKNFKRVHTFDKYDARMVRLDGKLYEMEEGVLEELQGLKGGFYNGLAKFTYTIDGKEHKGFVRPNGEIALLFKLPEF